MGFIAEYASQDDINRFRLDELLNKYQNTTLSYRHHWIVDKKRDYWLIPIKQIDNAITIWVFHYKNRDIEIKLYKTEDSWDLVSIEPNSFSNQEIISSLQEALSVLDTTQLIYASPKDVTSEEETNLNLKKTQKRKISYLDILTAIMVIIILFYITNDKSITSIFKSDHNKIPTTKPLYNVYAVVQTSNNTNAIYGMDHNKLDTWHEILSFNSRLSAVRVDKYGNIYWRDTALKSIYKANPDATNVRKIATDADGLSGIAIDNENERIFWIEKPTGKNYSEIVYTDFSGNNKHIITSNKHISTTTRGLFYDYVYDKLYITDWAPTEIISVDLKTQEVKKLGYASSSSSIVIDYKNKRVIWTNPNRNNITSTNFDGLERRLLVQFQDKMSHPNGITIDTINERLIYGYYDSVSDTFVLESSDLDGDHRKREKQHFYSVVKSLFFINKSENSVTKEKHAPKKTKIATIKNEPYDISKLQNCLACHGQDWSKPALGKSKVVKNMSKNNIARALKGYKNGTYGGPMKAIMKGQVAQYTDKDLDAIAEAIKSQ